MKTTKARLHQLVDQLPEQELTAAERYLEYLRDLGDPLFRALREAPEDDEPTTPQEDAGAEEAWHEYLQGKAIPPEEAQRRLLP